MSPAICCPAPRSRSAASSSGRPARRNRSAVRRRTLSAVPPKMMKPPTPISSASAILPASWAKPLSASERSAGRISRAAARLLASGLLPAG